MKKKLLIINFCMLLLFINVNKTFGLKHPGLLNSKADLDFVKEQVKAGKEPWKSAINHIKSLKFDKRNPSPKKKLVGLDNHDPMDAMTRDGSAAYACALLWYHTGEKKYANHAIKILNAWNIFQTHDNWLYLSWAVPQFLNAAEIIRTSNAGWSKSDQNKFKSMVQKRWLKPVKNNNWVNNAMMTSIEAYIAVAIYLDNENEFEAAVNKWRKWIPSYIYLKSDGRVPVIEGRSLERYWGTDASRYLNGQAMETCRDLNHTKMGTYGLMHGAEMAYQQGVDLWKEEEKRFTAFMELHAGWMTGKTKVPSWMCKGKCISCTGGQRAKNPPCNESNWDIAIGHLVNRLGHSLPTAQKMSNSHRFKESDTKRNFKFETLTHGNLPYGKVDIITDKPENQEGPEGYTFACNENDVVNINGTMDIAYGANGKYKYLYNQTSDIGCNNDVFGDPIAETAKKCYTKPVNLVSGVTLDKSSISLAIGQNSKLTETVIPTNVSNKKVSWSSSNPSIATVNPNGLVTAVATGSTSITATTDDGGYTATCKIEVMSEACVPHIEFSDAEQGENVASNLLDGLTDDDHRWSATDFPKEVIIDNCEILPIEGVKVWTYQNRSYHYTISIAKELDGEYQEVVNQSGTAPSNPIVNSFDPIDGRYVKLTVTGATGYSSNWVSINEIEVNVGNKISDFIKYPTDDIYTQNEKVYNTTELKVENDGRRRIAYMKFDLSNVAGSVTDATLTLKETAAEAGNGTIKVYIGSNSDWSESNTGSLPTKGTEIGIYKGSIAKNETFDINLSGLTVGQATTLIVDMNAGGNDIAFISGEGTTPPKLEISTLKTSILTESPAKILSNIRIYPNPAHDVLNIEINEDFKAGTRIRIIDISGKPIISKKLKSAHSQINLTSFNNGIYILKIHTQTGIITKKIIKK